MYMYMYMYVFIRYNSVTLNTNIIKDNIKLRLIAKYEISINVLLIKNRINIVQLVSEILQKLGIL